LTVNGCEKRQYETYPLLVSAMIGYQRLQMCFGFSVLVAGFE
jgi:hypothetical protein